MSTLLTDLDDATLRHLQRKAAREARRMRLSIEDGEDAVQEKLLQALTKNPKLVTNEAYFSRSVENHLIDATRKPEVIGFEELASRTADGHEQAAEDFIPILEELADPGPLARLEAAEEQAVERQKVAIVKRGLENLTSGMRGGILAAALEIVEKQFSGDLEEIESAFGESLGQNSGYGEATQASGKTASAAYTDVCRGRAILRRLVNRPPARKRRRADRRDAEVVALPEQVLG